MAKPDTDSKLKKFLARNIDVAMYFLLIGLLFIGLLLRDQIVLLGVISLTLITIWIDLRSK